MATNQASTNNGRVMWPTGTDYALSIQNPHVAFADAQLSVSETATNMMGMPLVASGQNAVVFLLRAPGKEYAVRCFTTPPAEGADRYDALHEHLGEHNNTRMVTSRWIDSGINVNGGSWPVVVMPWVNGQPLNIAVEDNLDNKPFLDHLADQWVEMVAQLQAADVTHGDLQHGNVLVSNEGQFSLVDLDGAWVPTMKVGPPGESGHPNYQHPKRTAENWGRNGDSFPAFLIETSLRALAADSSLGTFFSGENLLFTRSDLVDRTTPVWAAVAASPDPKVVVMVNRLAALCEADPRQIMLPYDTLRDSNADLSNSNVEFIATSTPTPTVKSLPTEIVAEWWTDTPEHATLSIATELHADPAASGQFQTIYPVPQTIAKTSLLTKLGKDSIISGLVGGLFAGLVGSLFSGILNKALPDSAMPMDFILPVSMLLGAVLLSWQSFIARAFQKAFTQFGFGALLGGLSGAVALLPADRLIVQFNSINQPATDAAIATTADGAAYFVYHIPAYALGLVWAIVAALVGLAIGSTRSMKTGLYGLVGGGIGGFCGGVVFGAQVANFKGHQLVVNGLEVGTIAIVLLVCGAIGVSFGLASKLASVGRLVVVEGRLSGLEILISSRGATIGSSNSDTLSLSGDATVSPHHAKISNTAGIWAIEPSAHVRVNGRDISMATAVAPGDIIMIGQSFVRLDLTGGL